MGNLAQGNFQVGAGHLEGADLVLQVSGRGFQGFCGQLPRFFQRLGRAHADGRAAGEERARAGTAKTVAAVGVAQHHAHFVQRHVEHVHHQLCQRGGNALAHGVDGTEDLDDAVGHDAHVDVFFQGVATCPFQEGGNAQAAPAAARGRFRRTLFKALPIRLLHALVHHRFKGARVIGLAHGVFVRHLGRLNEVATAQFQTVHAGLTCGLVHQALNVVNGFRPARTPVSAGGCGVGHDRREMEVDQLDVVHAGLHPGADHHLNGHARHAGVGADVGLVVNAQRQNFAVGVQRHFALADDVAAMGAGQKVFAALGNPFDRALQFVGAVGHHNVFCVGAGFHAEAAAHIAHNDAHFVGRNAQQVGDLGANARGHLGAHAHRDAAFVDVGQHAARLQRQGHQALVGDVQLDHMGGLGKRGCGRIRIAITGFGHAVVRAVGNQRGIGGQGIVQGDSARQLFKLDLHRFGRIARLLFGVGHHSHQRFAHKAHALSRQDVAIG